MMNKILLVIALVGLVFASGCVQEEVPTNTDTISLDVSYHDGGCRRDTDCLLTHCEFGTKYDCVNTIQTETIIKCTDLGKMVAEKNYDLCGCVDAVCQGK